MRRVRIDELGEEGEKEDRRLRVEDVQDSLRERTTFRSPPSATSGSARRPWWIERATT